MLGLLHNKLIEIWERGRHQHPLDQALTILTGLSKGETRRELADLSIGRRDDRLLALREQLFGKTLQGHAACPVCNERVEFSVSIDELRSKSIVSVAHGPELTCGDYHIRFRVPDSWDLAAVANCTNAETAGRRLVERCLLHATQNKTAIDPNQLPEDVIRKVEQAIAAHDPMAEILLDLNCPECGRGWQLLFDIVTFFWIEIAVKAKHLLLEIHTLAKVYGWTEAEILKLSDARRQIYLEMATA